MVYQVLAIRGERKYLVGTYAHKSYALGQAYRYKRQHPGYIVSVYSVRTNVAVVKARVS